MQADKYTQRVLNLIGQGKVQEAAALSHWLNGVQNQQAMRRLEEGMAVPEEGQAAVFLDSHSPAFGESYQVVVLALAPGSATYQAVIQFLRSQFAFTPDGTPEPKV